MKKKFIFFTFCFLMAFTYINNKDFQASASEVNYESDILNAQEISLEINSLDVETNTYKVTFDLNGGNYNGSQNNFEEIYAENSLINCPDETALERNNCVFQGWYTLDNKGWDFENNTITCDIVLRAKWHWLTYYPIQKKGKWTKVEDYLKEKHYNLSYLNLLYENQTKQVSGKNIIEMDLDEFPESDRLEAIQKTGVESTYGGCGPISMMGVMHYLSDALGYSQIIDNPQDSSQRVSLACDILLNTKTFEVGEVGNKNTFTWPWDYVDSFNGLMEKYGLGDYIKSVDQLSIFQNKDELINKIKTSVDNGLPVTLYTAVPGAKDDSSSEVDLKSHYVNIYGYQEWRIQDRDGNFFNDTIFLYRQNWGWTESAHGITYLDADLLNDDFTGIIYYEILKYDEEKTIISSDFSKEFINKDTGQGQYFFYEEEAMITTTENYSFNTKRLRCSYIENQYLVLSANRKGSGVAYLEFQLNEKIKKMTFDMCLWSAFEGLKTGGTIRIDIPVDSNNEEYGWKTFVIYDANSLKTVKSLPKNYIVLFPKEVSKFRFYVTKDIPDTDRNHGRIVLDNIHLYFNEKVIIHHHNFVYTGINKYNHSITCSCGIYTIKPHIVQSSAAGNLTTNCIQCGYQLHLRQGSSNNDTDFLNGRNYLPDTKIIFYTDDEKRLLNNNQELSQSLDD
ncbi:MAG: InlB B-repeat-containing protein [Anaeroplasmataceae bacterium]|nr:InlB B-repeat-containing protein [Anaeroplasmataceae bacterium]